MNVNILNLINVQAYLHVSGGYGSVYLNKVRQVEACSFSEVLEFPLVLGRDFSGRVVGKGLRVGYDINIGDEVWGALPPYLQGCHAQFVRVNKTSVSEYADLIMCLSL
jgi:NADPH:quinone reductase-like Zn-dependent oxidoreductase